jgi:Uma2 family endonuclease
MSVVTEPVQPGLYHFNVHEYMNMFEESVLAIGVRTELIEGKIVTMSPANAPHVAVIGNLTKLLIEKEGEHAKLFVQCSFQIDELTLPEPNFQLMRHREDNYQSALPTLDDCLLLIEVSHTSLKYDREVKLPLYAAAGIPEVWIVDVTQQVVEQYSQPKENRYENVTIHSRGKRIQATGLEAIDLAVDEIFV